MTHYKNSAEFGNNSVHLGDTFEFRGLFGKDYYVYDNISGFHNFNPCVDPEKLFRDLNLNRVELYEQFYNEKCNLDCDWPQRPNEDPEIITILVKMIFEALEEIQH